MSNWQESRRSFRVIESIYLKYEVISDLEYEQGLECWKLRLGTSTGVRSRLLDANARFNEKLHILKSESSTIAECMMLLNDKMNMILEEFPNFREAKGGLARQTPQPCEICAEGMLFGVHKQYPPDTKIALRFLLGAGNHYVETFSRVVRNVDTPSDLQTDLPFRIAVEFHGMSSAQKDIIIQNLFHKESETLRTRRLRNHSTE